MLKAATAQEGEPNTVAKKHDHKSRKLSHPVCHAIADGWAYCVALYPLGNLGIVNAYPKYGVEFEAARGKRRTLAQHHDHFQRVVDCPLFPSEESGRNLTGQACSRRRRLSDECRFRQHFFDRLLGRFLMTRRSVRFVAATQAIGMIIKYHAGER